MWRKVLGISLLVIVVIVVVAVIVIQRKGGDSLFKKEKEKSEEAIFEAARLDDLKITVEATGQTEPISDIEVKSEATGRIVEFYVEEGDEIIEGDLICKLDQSNQLLTVQRMELATKQALLRYEEAKQATATTTRSGLNTQLEAARNQLASAEEANANALASYDRISYLHERGFATDPELEGARQQVISTEGSLATARENLANAEVSQGSYDEHSEENSIELARLSWESSKVTLAEARKQLGDSVIKSPINGIILEKPLDIGDSVQSINSSFGQGTTIVKVADLKRIQVRTSVDELDIGSVKVGQDARITVDTYFDREFDGVVTNIYPQGVQTGQGLVSFIAIVEVDNAEGLLLGNMTASVSIDAKVLEGVLLVPLAATRAGEEEDSTIVYVLNEDEDPFDTEAASEEREIKVGETDYYDIVVLEGLEEGELIKVRGFEQNIQLGG